MLGKIVNTMKAQILKPTTENLQFCSQVLHNGGLVGFPTGNLYQQYIIIIETVYGLGANALNRDAVCDIFKAKNRPFNGLYPLICSIIDPVIVHVLSEEDAERYIDVCEEVIMKLDFHIRNAKYSMLLQLPFGQVH